VWLDACARWRASVGAASVVGFRWLGAAADGYFVVRPVGAGSTGDGRGTTLSSTTRLAGVVGELRRARRVCRAQPQ